MNERFLFNKAKGWVHRRTLILKSLWIFLFLVPSLVWAQRLPCVESPIGALIQILDPAVKVRPLSEIKELKIGSYNVLNLFENVGKFVPDEKGLTLVRPPTALAQSQIDGVAKAMKDIDADVWVLLEVEGDLLNLEKYNKQLLGNQFKAVMLNGNDQRGIKIGLYFKKDLPFSVEAQTHRDLTMTDPAGLRLPPGQNPPIIPVFSRDLPVFHFREQGKGLDQKPLFTVIGNHAKSMRDRQGDPKSILLRTAQYKKASQIVNEIYTQYGKDSKIIFCGDFNTKVGGPETVPLFKDSGLSDTFDLVVPPVGVQDRVTHTFHPFQGSTEKNQIDGVLVSPVLKDSVKEAYVYRYKDPETGRVRPIPDTRAQRDLNPSDHFPAVSVFDFEKFIQK